MDNLQFDDDSMYIEPAVDITTAEFLEIQFQSKLLEESFKFNIGTVTKEQIAILNDAWFKLNKVRKELNRRNDFKVLYEGD